MYQNSILKNHIETSSAVSMQSLILAEWNMNIADNIDITGNYRYRPNDNESDFHTIQSSYDSTDTAGAYTDATYSHTIFNTGINTAGTEPTVFVTNNRKEELLYSLTDCLNRFRPRSGINKLRYFEGKYINYSNSYMFLQPRYYLSSKDDKFKYWTSYREEMVKNSSIKRGIGQTPASLGYYIDDAAPFVVYKNPVPANRIVVKMQTNASSFENPSYTTDPFYEDPTAVSTMVNQTTPIEWKIQYLNNSNQWIDAKSFNSATIRENLKRVIDTDGYVQLNYGITNSLGFSYKLLGEYTSVYSLPLSAEIGNAYLVPDITQATTGTIYVWNGTDWTTNSFAPIYGWYLAEEDITDNTSIVTELVSPKVYGTPTNKYTATYREFQYIKGIRIVVTTINKFNSTFDLIEMSPRLVADFSERTISYSIDKIASDIGNSGFPVGSLSVSNGTIDIFDYDQSFNVNNNITLNSGVITGSILSDTNWNISSKNLQLKFYEVVQNVLQDDDSYKNYYVPIKTMYVDGFPAINSEDRKVKLTLRDLFFYFESITAPPILLKNVSLTYAVATILDSIGFSNYSFKYSNNESDFTIPYFYVQPDITVAELLKQLAQSSQATMFFDEMNNFILMSKNYLMGTDDYTENTKKDEDIVLYGTDDFTKNEIIKNQSPSQSPTKTPLTNIVSLDSENNLVYNGGKITYSNKYLQKSYSTVQEASLLPKNQVFKYRPVLLWEIAGTSQLRPVNEEVSDQSAYTLAAISLNSTLDDLLPSTDKDGNMVNNVINFGQSIYWATRYNGYFYNNSEIIKYDAIEYSRTIVPVKNLIAHLTEGENTFKLTSGNINKLKVNQVIGQTSQAGGQFANNVKITKINLATGEITVSANHVTTGDVIFEATELDVNVWITSVEEYQKYFAQLPFNGKLYPSGRVRIYAEPTYNTDGTLKTNSASITNITTTTGQSVTFTAANNFILGQRVSVSGLAITGTTVGGLTAADLNQTYKITSCSTTTFTATALTAFPVTPTVQTKTATGQSITGAVAAKHGRMQFGTGTYDTNKQMKPCVHEVFSEDSDWLNPDKAKTFAMASEWIFGNDHQYINTSYTLTTTASGATTYSTTGTVSSLSGPVNGRYYATIINLGANGNNFTVDQTISATGTGAFTNAKVEEIVSASTIKVSKPSAAFTAGALTAITGTSNAAGSNILNVKEDISSLQTGYIFSSGSQNIPDGTKIKALKTFQVGVTTYHQIILSKPITPSSFSGETSIVFVDKILESPVLGSINFDLNTQNQLTASRYSVDLFDSSYYNESTYKKNQSKVRPLGSIKSSALTLSGALNFYDSATITKYDGNGKYTANNTFDVGDVVNITTGTDDIKIDGTKTITAVTSGSFTVSDTIGNIISKTATIGTVSGSGPYTATVTVLNTTDLTNISAGQILTAGDGTTGSFGSGVVTVVSKNVGAKTISISSTKTITAGDIKNLRAPVDLTIPANKKGIAIVDSTNASDYVSYVYRPYFNKTSMEKPNPVYFGTRLRIIGELLKKQKDTNQIEQLPIGASRINTEISANTTYEIKGTGGGIAINLDVSSNKNSGYYFEIDALTLSTLKDTASTASTSIPNIYFYKILKGNSAKEAIPIVLWYGSMDILCDDGSFAGQETVIGKNNGSVYDLAISQVQEVSGTKTKKTFNLYINNKLVATVVDNDALPTVDDAKNSALFVRGSGQVMFENFFTIADSKDVTGTDEYKKEYAFNKQKFDTSSFRKYLIHPFVLDKTLQGIGPNKPTLEYMIDYEEFGSIFRECAYFNVRYDKAYPALYSQIASTYNNRQGYVVSGYTANPYSAEFLVFNATDFALNLDNTTGNYLRINGVSFTQQSNHDITVDEYFTKNSDFNAYSKLNTQYIDIQNSRSLYGRNDFTIQGEYIQNQDTANSLMKWIVDKIMKPKKSVGVKIFANPMIQLGDIVKINYAQDDVNIIDPNTKFVIYHITLNRTKDGPEMTLYLSEVV